MKKWKQEAFYEFFYLIRSTLPTSNLFYIVFFGLKFIGLFISTHNTKCYEDNLYTVSYLLHKLTLFGFSLQIVSNGYFITSIVLFALLIILLISLTLVYLQLLTLHKRKATSQLCFTSQEQFKPRRNKLSIQITCFIIFFILFFSHYVQEYLSFIILVLIFQHNINSNSPILDKEHLQLFNHVYQSSFISPIALCVINGFSLLILNALLFMLMLLNSTKALWLRSGFDGYSNKLILLGLLVLFWFQSLFIDDYVFTGKYLMSCRIVFNIISVVLLSLFLFSHLKYFNHFHSTVPQFNLFISVWCWYSGLLEILIFYICDKPFNQAYSFLKLIVELTNAVIFTYVIVALNTRHFLSQFSAHLFDNTQKQSCLGESFAYIHLLTQALQNKLPQHLELVAMIQAHKSKCVTQGCPCLKLMTSAEDKMKRISFEEKLIIIGEHDIASRIYQLYKKNKGQSYPIEDYVMLHVGYIYEIKQHFSFALYLASKYLHSKLKLGLLTKCFLFEIKQQIIRKVFSNKRIQRSNYYTTESKVNYLEILNRQNETNAINSNLKAFYDYITFIEIIKSLMIECCNGLEAISAIRSSLQSSSKFSPAMDKRQYELFIFSCEKIKKSNDKLIQLIKRQMKGDVLCHSELSYLLTNYFDLLYKKVPCCIRESYQPLSAIAGISPLEHLNDYLKFDIRNPLILKFTDSDSFVIDYISTDLCGRLGYIKANLIGTDIHDHIPAELVDNHKLFMKQFLFIQHASLVRDTFILSAEQNLVNIQLNSKVLPSMTTPFFIIIDATIFNHKSASSFVYFFILDSSLKMLAVNQRFEEQFLFNIKMIELLKVNFCGFFGLNEGRFQKKVRESFKKCKETNLEEEAKAIAITSNVKQDKVFSYRRIKQSVKSSQSFLKDIIEKQQVLDGLSALIKIVNDLGLDIEWYNRVRHLGDRIKLSLEQSIANQLNAYYDTMYYLRQIGPQRYFVVKMKEFVDVKSIMMNTMCSHESLIKQRVNDASLYSEMKQQNLHMKAIMKLSSQSVLAFDKSKGSKFLKSPMISSRADASPMSSKAIDSDLMAQSSTSKFSLLQKKPLLLNKSSKVDYSISTDNNLNSANTFGTWTKKKTAHSNARLHSSLKRDGSEYVINEAKRLQMYVSYSKLSRRYTLLFYSTSSLLVVMICVFIIVKYTLMSSHKDLYNVIVFASLVKTDLLFGAMLNMGLCIEIDLKDEDKKGESYDSTINEEFNSISNDLIKHYSIFTSYLNAYVSNKSIKPIYEVINQIESYENLQENWSTKTVNSSLTELIYIFRLFFSQSTEGSQPLCRLKELFYNEKHKGIEEASKLKAASIEEQLLFFNIYNLMTKIKPKFEVLRDESASLVFDYNNYFSQLVKIYNIAIWVVTMWLLFVLFAKVIIDQKLTKTICSYIYTQSSHEENDERKLIAFRDIVIDFSKKKITVFEELKNKPGLNKHLSTVSLIKGTNHSKDPATSSSMSPLTRQSIHTKNLRLHLQTIPKGQKPFQPQSFVFNSEILIIVIVVVVFSSLELCSVLLSLRWEENILLSTSIAIDFLERIPILIELLFYSELSAVMNRVDYISKDNTQPSKREKYLNYYKKSIDITHNTQVGYLNDSLYATLYYESWLVEANIGEFSSHPSKMLSSVKLWEGRLNEKGGICIYGVIGAEYNKVNEDKAVSINEYFKRVNEKVKECRVKSQSVAVNSFDLAIEYLIQGLTNVYFDFANSRKENEERIDWFLHNQSIYQSNYAYPMKSAFQTYSYFLLNDLTLLHKSIIGNDLFLSFVLLIVFLVVFIYAMLGIIKKSDHYKSLLIFFASLAFSSFDIDLSFSDD